MGHRLFIFDVYAERLATVLVVGGSSRYTIRTELGDRIIFTFTIKIIKLQLVGRGIVFGSKKVCIFWNGEPTFG
jgi:hypothetical protein